MTRSPYEISRWAVRRTADLMDAFNKAIQESGLRVDFSYGGVSTPDGELIGNLRSTDEGVVLDVSHQ